MSDIFCLSVHAAYESASVPRDAEYDGLDAREAFPPLLRPGVLMDWDTLARHAHRHRRMLDRSLLRQSLRQADLLLVHLASRDALARRWSAAEAEHEDRVTSS